MAVINKINVGEKANDGKGDTLRDAFVKVNQSFEALNQAVQKNAEHGQQINKFSSELKSLTSRIEALEKTKE
ncbi:hypothetical protein ACSNKN_18485 [Proteus mirabilis]|uniref:hypothetical protein n=1 Tax=Proteus mirabilis TaxID=584 RepID=UPI003F1DDD52